MRLVNLHGLTPPDRDNPEGPVSTVVSRKGYRHGAQSTAAGGFHSPVFTVAGELGGMGIEGASSTGTVRSLFDDPLGHNGT